MKKMFKFIILFFCMWSGLFSLIQISKGSSSFLEMIFYFLVFSIFIVVPAFRYWQIEINKAYENEINKENNNNDKIK